MASGALTVDFITHNRTLRVRLDLSTLPKQVIIFNLKKIGKEPPARIELATSSLPMRCYTAKPWWRICGDLPSRYNRFGVEISFLQPFRLNRKCLSAGLRPRSHSLVLRATGNRVSLWHESSNLSLGATLSAI